MKENIRGLIFNYNQTDDENGLHEGFPTNRPILFAVAAVNLILTLLPTINLMLPFCGSMLSRLQCVWTTYFERPTILYATSIQHLQHLFHTDLKSKY